MQAIQLDSWGVLQGTSCTCVLCRVLSLTSVQCQWETEDNVPVLQGNKVKSETAGNKVKVSYLTEQTSHHPPVSAYYVDCPQKAISARGFDQISAKFTGTSIRVTPGVYNEGIYVTLHNWGDETYHLTHPAAYLGGFLRGILANPRLPSNIH